MHITYICTHTHTNSKSAFSIYIICTLYIQLLYLNMHLIWHVPLFFPGYCGTHHPPAQSSHGIEDNAPDPICLLAMMNLEDLHLLNLVRFHFNGQAYHILCICLVYEMYLHCTSHVHGNDRTGILRVYTPYSISCIEN